MSSRTDPEALRLRLVGQLVDDDVLHDPAWIAAHRVTPRELFVPHITQIGNSSAALLAARSGEPVTGEPTSSSSAPSLMALMLEGLAGQDGNRVLEVGTGSGYNAALLCQRWGADLVTSVDVDPWLCR